MSTSGQVKWSSPSNIALIKYWGKYGVQLPQNSSISFTLNNAKTITEIKWEPKKGASFQIDFLLDGKPEDSFQIKLNKYFNSLTHDFPFILEYDFFIKSGNTFPHSSGIASSASSMSSLALCLQSLDYIQREKSDSALGSPSFLKKASHYARLGSGSASRSLFPICSSWGDSPDLLSSQEFAAPVLDVHPIFKTYHDDILIISSGKKSISSRSGHQLMEQNPYADTRYNQAEKNIRKLLGVLKSGDCREFVKIVEQEALDLHGLMMISNPGFILMKPNTISTIKKVQEFRVKSNIPLCFTLDAGPNVHLLYPDEYALKVRTFINDELISLTENNTVISDFVGNGPELLNLDYVSR